MKKFPKTSKVITYIKRNVRNKTWQLGDKIDSITSIASKVGVSWQTARKGVRYLCKNGLLEYNTYGFYVVGQPSIRLSTALQQLNIITRTKANLKASKMLINGGKFDGRYVAVLLKEETKFKIFYPLSNNEYIFNINDILDTFRNPISTKMLFDNNSLKQRYNIQTNIRDHIDIIKRNMDMLS